MMRSFMSATPQGDKASAHLEVGDLGRAVLRQATQLIPAREREHQHAGQGRLCRGARRLGPPASHPHPPQPRVANAHCRSTSRLRRRGGPLQEDRAFAGAAPGPRSPEGGALGVELGAARLEARHLGPAERAARPAQHVAQRRAHATPTHRPGAATAPYTTQRRGGSTTGTATRQTKPAPARSLEPARLLPEEHAPNVTQTTPRGRRGDDNPLPPRAHLRLSACSLTDARPNATTQQGQRQQTRQQSRRHRALT